MAHGKVRIIFIRKAAKPRNGISIWAAAQSRTRGLKIIHLLVKRGRCIECACEDSMFNRPKGGCDHAKELRRKLRTLALRLARKAA